MGGSDSKIGVYAHVRRDLESVRDCVQGCPWEELTTLTSRCAKITFALEAMPFDPASIPAIRACLAQHVFPTTELTFLLLVAVKQGHVAVVEDFLNKNADPNAVDDIGCPPLRRAAMYGHVEVTELLLARKAHVNYMTPHKATALMGASECGKLEVVELLLTHKAELNAVNSHKETALILAAVDSRYLVVSRLLRAGANMLLKDEWGRSAVELAPRAMMIAQSHYLLTNCATGLPVVLLGFICEYAFDEKEFNDQLNESCNKDLTRVQWGGWGYYKT